jgi:macrophage erythroblast attacher
MIARMQTLKRKLENLHHEEDLLHEHSAKRIRHLQDLYQIPSLADVKYENWSRTRLDRLVVDYLLRSGHSATATSLAEAKDITHLIDLDVFTSCHRIASAIKNGEVKEALTWVNENRNALKKLPISLPTTQSTTAESQPPNVQLLQSSTLEFELRLQQYIELIRASTTSKKLEAMAHAAKYITPHSATRPDAILASAGLLIQPPNANTEPYKSLFSQTRWDTLSNLFVSTHHVLLNLPTQPLLHTALSAGLSALKTPACHSVHNPASSSSAGHARLASNASLCPICSIELNDLARSVPYAHHTKPHVENNPVVLPNGRIYGRERLEELQRKKERASGGAGSGTVLKGGAVDEDLIGKEGEVTDPTTGETFLWEEVKKVYIT